MVTRFERMDGTVFTPTGAASAQIARSSSSVESAGLIRSMGATGSFFDPARPRDSGRSSNTSTSTGTASPSSPSSELDRPQHFNFTITNAGAPRPTTSALSDTN